MRFTGRTSVLTKPKHEQRGTGGSAWTGHFLAAKQRISAQIQRRQNIVAVAVVLLVTAAAVAVTAQGWRSRILTFDLVTALRAAHTLIATGALPQYSDIGTYGSFNTPGPAWLMLPSTLLSADPRLSQYVGAGLLHFLTLLGIFLLGRKYFGLWCGCLAVALYGLSGQGLWWAGSLWTFGSPDMFIWLVYLASVWVTRRDGRFLAAAIGVWALGMYVDLALAPAIAVLPAIWLVYRPPVALKPLLAAAAVLLVVWFPYLRFEAGRDFIDLRSQFLLRHILPADASGSWCDPRRKLRTWHGTTSTAATLATAAYARAAASAGAARSESSSGRLDKAIDGAFQDRLLSNFLVTKLPGQRVIGIVLLLCVLASLVLFSVTGSAPKRERSEDDARGSQTSGRRPEPGWASGITVGAVVLVLAGWFVLRQLAFSGGLPPLVRGAMAIFLLAGIAVLFPRLTAFVDRLLNRRGIQIQREEQAHQRRLIVVGLAVPWILLFGVAEPGIPERFLWLLPLQVLVLAAFVVVLLPRLGAPRSAVGLVQALLVVVFLWNSFLVPRVDDWRANGWSGRDATEVRVADYIAQNLNRDGRDRAAIGYQTFIYPFMANYNIVNSNYKVGADFDVIFKYQHGITNTDTCAEGVSSRDEYRIVQTRPMNVDEAPMNYFEVPLGKRFKMVRRIGPYRIFKAARTES